MLGYNILLYAGNEEAQESMRNGTFMYDNRISVNHQNMETMIESYESFRDFIESTRSFN